MKRIILDTDTAGDDTIAILIAALHPSFHLEAITIAGGNVNFDQQVENALYTLQVAGKSGKVPVYKGHEHPIMGKHQTVEAVHGSDGMGDSFFEKAVQRPESAHAVDIIIEKVHQYPGELHLLAIAPLTNIAMALLRDPSIAAKIPHIYIMGGTNNALGNITPAAEYNFWVDPEAARIVLRSGIPITMVGWEMATRYSVMDDDDHAEIAALQTAGSQFFLDVNRVVMKFNKSVHRLNGTTHPDALLAAVAADEKVMTKSNRYFVDVELKGEYTRGYSVVDVNGRLGMEPNVTVCEEIDRAAFKSMLLKILSEIH
jgi:purine nucleosidase